MHCSCPRVPLLNSSCCYRKTWVRCGVLSRCLGYLMVSQTAQDPYVQVTESRPKYQTTIIFLPSLTAKEYCRLTRSNSTQGCCHGVAIFHYTRLIWFDGHQTCKKYERLKLYFCLKSSDYSWRSLSKVQSTLQLHQHVKAKRGINCFPSINCPLQPHCSALIRVDPMQRMNPEWVDGGEPLLWAVTPSNTYL